MTLTIDDEVLLAAGLTDKELLVDIAAMLYQKKGLSLGKASDLAQMNRIFFLKELAARQIPVNYDLDELDRDLLDASS